jgi:hypothetical protein
VASTPVADGFNVRSRDLAALEASSADIPGRRDNASCIRDASKRGDVWPEAAATFSHSTAPPAARVCRKLASSSHRRLVGGVPLKSTRRSG